MSKNILLWVIVLSALFLGLAGSFLAIQLSKRKKIWINLGLGFGSGFLLVVAITDMLPEAAEQSSLAFLMAIIGFTAAYLLEHLFTSSDVVHSHDHDDEDDNAKVIGFVAFLTISIHSIIDGVAIATALISSVGLGIVVSTAVVVHKVPDGFSLCSLLISKHYSRKMLLWFVVILALATPFGAIISYYLLSGFSFNPGIFLGLSAGSFIYISTSHMLPEAHHAKAQVHLQISTSFIVGILLGLIPMLLGR